MKNNIFKGFIIGVGKIIPGVSGSMLAISLGVYEKLLGIIADIRRITVSKFCYLFSLVIGICLGICLFSRGVKWLLDVFYLPTMLLFIGLIIGGMPEIVKSLTSRGNKSGSKIISLAIFVLAFTFSYMISNLSGFGSLDNGLTGNVFIYFVLGVIEAFSSIVPGISGTAIFMSLGCYDMLLSFFSNLFNPYYFKFGIFFALGILTGVVVLAKLITYLLKNYKANTYYAIFGFMLSSLFVMFSQMFGAEFNIFELLVGLVLLMVGYKITSLLENLLASD